MREKDSCRELLLLRTSEYTKAGKLWALEGWKSFQQRQLLNSMRPGNVGLTIR